MNVIRPPPARLSQCTDFLTECDQLRERDCRRTRRQFLLQLRAYDQLSREFFRSQSELGDALWKLSVEYNILQDACPRGIYPQSVTDQVMCEMLQAKSKLIARMRCSLYDWLRGEAHQQLRRDYAAFASAARVVKWSLPSPLIAGSSTEKPLQFYVDRSLDAMYYLERLHKRVEAAFLAITLCNSDAMLAHSKTLAYSAQFAALLAELLLYGCVLMEQDDCGAERARSRTEQMIGTGLS